MASLTFERESSIERYRDRTEQNADCAGVTAPSFFCLGCNQRRLQRDRKKTGLGWRCARCYQRILARRSARSQEQQS